LAEDRHIFSACHDPDAVKRESIVRMREMSRLDPNMVEWENIAATWEMPQPDPEGVKLDSPGRRPGEAGNVAALAL
jgi:hypothetical protein